jgi:hypothetical protein
MACSQADYGGEGLQIWGVAANVLNKHLQTADKWWFSAWGLSEGLQLPTIKEERACFEMSHQASDLDGLLRMTYEYCGCAWLPLHRDHFLIYCSFPSSLFHQ